MQADRAGVLYSLAASLFAAAFYIPFQAAVRVAPRGGVVCALLVCAAVANSLTAAVRVRGRARPGRSTWVAALVLAGFTITGNVGVASALGVQKAAVTSVLLQTQILIVAGLGWIFLHERFGVRFVVGAILAVAGFVVMNLPAFGAAAGPVADPIGIAWALCAATSFAVMQVYIRAVIGRIDTVVVNAARLWLASLVFLAFPGNAAALAELGGRAWIYCAAAALLGPFLSRLCLMEAVRYISAARVALIVMVNPIFAGVFAFAAFGSLPSALEAFGAGLILSGIAAPLLTARRREAPR